MKAATVVEENLVRVLGDGGQVEKDKDPGLSEDDLQTLYRTMLLTRLLDERMVKFQRQGRIGFYIGSTGEEAAIVGAAFAMGREDWLVPAYPELGAAFLRGFSLRGFICQLFGNTA